MSQMEAANPTSLDDLVAAAEREFLARYRRAPRCVVAAPGRVNLIGEHIDYNDGFVLPMAIDRYVVIAAAEGLAGSEATFHSLNLNQTVMLATTGSTTSGEGQAAEGTRAPLGWARYVQGVIAGFLERGVTVPPCDAVIVSNVPLGGGLSSSAALEVATATLLEHLCGVSLPPTAKALLCQRAEHDYAGVPCGIMDQFSSVFGQPNHVILLDCRSQQIELIPFQDASLTVLICDTNVKHELTGGEYALRRRQCSSALAKLRQQSWRDVSQDLLDSRRDYLTDDEYRRARHVVSEIARTAAAANCCRAADWVQLGMLMYASHDSLRDDYEVSCAELDLLVAFSRDLGLAGGLFGSRMTGGGFGGCTVSFVQAESAAAISQSLAARYAEVTGFPPRCFASRPARGAHVVRG